MSLLPLPYVTGLKSWKKKRHITSIKNERGIITTASVDAKRIIRKYYEQLYADKSDSMEEMDKVLKRLK